MTKISLAQVGNWPCYAKKMKSVLSLESARKCSAEGSVYERGGPLVHVMH